MWDGQGFEGQARWWGIGRYLRDGIWGNGPGFEEWAKGGGLTRVLKMSQGWGRCIDASHPVFPVIPDLSVTPDQDNLLN